MLTRTIILASWVTADDAGAFYWCVARSMRRSGRIFDGLGPPGLHPPGLAKALTRVLVSIKAFNGQKYSGFEQFVKHSPMNR